MDLKIENVVVGTLYCNIRLDTETLPYSKPELAEKIKKQEFSVLLGSTDVKVKSYRRMYLADNMICIEGAELEL